MPRSSNPSVRPAPDNFKGSRLPHAMESAFAFLRIWQRIPLFLGSTRTRRRFFSEATARGRSSEPFEAESRLRRRDEINRIGACYRTGQARISAETASIRCIMCGS